MKHSLFESTLIKLFSGVLLFTLLQACGGGGDSKSMATDSTQEQTSVTAGPSVSTVADSDTLENFRLAPTSDASATDFTPHTAPDNATPAQQPDAPTDIEVDNGMFPTSPRGFPISGIPAEIDEYFDTWHAVNPSCESALFGLGLPGKYSKENSLFISQDLVERRVDIFHDSSCQNKAVQMIYALYWVYSPILMSGHDNPIRIEETTVDNWYHLDGGTGFTHSILAGEADPRFIIADVHDGKLYLTPAPDLGLPGYPKRLNPARYYIK